jgi:hypothetical protein
MGHSEEMGDDYSSSGMFANTSMSVNTSTAVNLLDANQQMYKELGVSWRTLAHANDSVVIQRAATKTPQEHCGWKDTDTHDVKVKQARSWLSDNVGLLRICVENDDAEWRDESFDIMMSETIVTDSTPVDPNNRRHILQLNNCGSGKTTCLTGMALINQHFVPAKQSLVTVVVYANVTLMDDAFGLLSRMGVNVVKGRSAEEIRRLASEMVGSGTIVTVIDTFVYIAQDWIFAMMNDGTIRRIYFDEAHELAAQANFRTIFGQFANVAKSAAFSRINWTLMSGTFPAPIRDVVLVALGIDKDEITAFSSTSGYSLSSVSIQAKESESKEVAMDLVVEECCKSARAGKSHLVAVLSMRDADRMESKLQTASAAEGGGDFKCFKLNSNVRKLFGPAEVEKQFQKWKGGEDLLWILVSTQPLNGLNHNALFRVDVLGSYGLLAGFQTAARCARKAGQKGVVMFHNYPRMFHGSEDQEIYVLQSQSYTKFFEGGQCLRKVIGLTLYGAPCWVLLRCHRRLRRLRC